MLTKMETQIKTIALVAILLFIESASAACTTISRSNSSPNAILTSTKYNLDSNTVYAAVNSLDGECLQTGTILLASLDTAEFAAILNTPKIGCLVTKSDAATLSVSKCLIAVNGAYVSTTIATTVTWGCTSCVSESSSAVFYLYAKNGSTGTTLTLLITSTAPNADGYDSSSNRALGKFYNDSSGDIYNGIGQWDINRFEGFVDSVILYTGNGYGSTNTNVRRFANTNLNVGSTITYTDSAANGATFTVNEAGIYSVSASDHHSASTGFDLAISWDAGTPNSSAAGISGSERVCISSEKRSGTSNVTVSCSATRPLISGAVLRLHTDGNGSTSSGQTQFTITKVNAL